MAASQAELCGCGVRHRSEAAAAKCPDAPRPLVDAEDVLGVLSLLDGRLVRTATGVLAVSPSRFTPEPLPEQWCTQRDVFRVMAALSAEPHALAEKVSRYLRTGLPIAAAVPVELAERTAAALSDQLKSAA